jgi:hypothetical protein
MRLNKFGVPHLEAVRLKRIVIYFWTPPRALQKARIFRYTTLGANFELAVVKARELNFQLEGTGTPRIRSNQCSVISSSRRSIRL